ncbi:MAG: hypothetical protein JWQ88_3466 [Rhodoferax sp.]|nr:hypothetical protein [Rhodoferax sp.]
MFAALSFSALLMGLAGGPHCVAMCGAACGALTRGGSAAPTGGVHVISFVRPGRPGWPDRPGVATANWALHGGRVAGYAAAGALAAATAQGLGEAGTQLAALRPLWMLLHAGIFAWGLVLAVAGRQPVWSSQLGGLLARRLHAVTGTATGLFATGLAWTTMPCGLLYSALMLAALAGSAVQGAGVMALFSLGGVASLVVAPWVWARVRWLELPLRGSTGTRIAGLLLAAAGAHAVWSDVARQIAIWCR